MKIALRVEKNQKKFIQSPIRMIVISFACLIILGSILLSLPFATESGNSAPYIDALFTSTSAVCVTGLIVQDTATYWSAFGEVVILLLIQAGGLGILTITTFFGVFIGKKMGMRKKIIAKESINTFSLAEITRVVRHVVAVTFGCEFIGAVILTTRFAKTAQLPTAIYRGVFHSISAFCNAGFDILGTSKDKFQNLIHCSDDPIILFTIMGLIIIGGLGFVVWSSLFAYTKTKSLTTHTKLVLTMTAILLVVGSILFFLIEHNNPATIGHMSFFQKIYNSMFASVTSRTAGYTSIPLGGLRELSKALTIALMFIGAAPGSTGGGIKVTTFGVLIAMVLSYFRGNDEAILFKNRLDNLTIKKAVVITCLSFILVIVTTSILAGVENMPFIDCFYESTSAFATVGLSTGMTPFLHFASKMALILTMFFGRVGPASFALAVSLKAKKKKDLIYPEAKINVG